MGYARPKSNESFTDVDSEKISSLLGELKHVNAPGDFNFKVRSRIASGAPAVSGGWVMPVWAKAAVPLVLLAGLTTYFTLPPGSTPVTESPSQAQQQSVLPPPPAIVPQNVTEQPSNVTVASKTDVAPTTQPDLRSLPKSTDKRPVASPTASGGSFDAAAGVTKKIIPGGGTETAPAANTGVPVINIDIPAADLLNQLGVKATFDGKSWKAESVGAGSAASRSGVKAGDVIEAVNGKPLGTGTKVPSSVKSRSVRVVRDGKPIEIKIDR